MFNFIKKSPKKEVKQYLSWIDRIAKTGVKNVHFAPGPFGKLKDYLGEDLLYRGIRIKKIVE
jgi:hypothetical protein